MDLLPQQHQSHQLQRSDNRLQRSDRQCRMTGTAAPTVAWHQWPPVHHEPFMLCGLVVSGLHCLFKHRLFTRQLFTALAFVAKIAAGSVG